MRSHSLLLITLLIVTSGTVAAKGAPVTDKETAAVLSPAFGECFGKDAPLNAESYGCLDREYHRLDALLTNEYRDALARQRTAVSRSRLQSDERKWWRTRFHHCRTKSAIWAVRLRQS